MRPYSPQPYESAIWLAILGACALVVVLYAGCTLHENPIGHRIDQPVVVVHPTAKPDDDGGAR